MLFQQRKKCYVLSNIAHIGRFGPKWIFNGTKFWYILFCKKFILLAKKIVSTYVFQSQPFFNLVQSFFFKSLKVNSSLATLAYEHKYIHLLNLFRRQKICFQASNNITNTPDPWVLRISKKFQTHLPFMYNVLGLVHNMFSQHKWSNQHECLMVLFLTEFNVIANNQHEWRNQYEFLWIWLKQISQSTGVYEPRKILGSILKIKNHCYPVNYLPLIKGGRKLSHTMMTIH